MPPQILPIVLPENLAAGDNLIPHGPGLLFEVNIDPERDDATERIRCVWPSQRKHSLARW